MKRQIPDNIDIFRSRLDELLDDHHTTVSDLHRKKIASKSAIYNYRYAGRMPTALSIAKIAAYFNVSADWLLGLSSVKEPPPVWIFVDGECQCSNCGNRGETVYRFCPSCGKEMNLLANNYME